MSVDWPTAKASLTTEQGVTTSVQLRSPDDGSVVVQPQPAFGSLDAIFFVAGDNIYIMYRLYSRTAVAVVDKVNFNAKAHLWISSRENVRRNYVTPVTTVSTVFEEVSIVRLLGPFGSSCVSSSQYFYFSETYAGWLEEGQPFQPSTAVGPDGASYMKLRNNFTGVEYNSQDSTCGESIDIESIITAQNHNVEVYSSETGELERVVDVNINDVNAIVNLHTPQFLSCFSGETIVRVLHQGLIYIKNLQLGDKVLVADGTYESVYSFGRRSDDAAAKFLQIRLKSGFPPLEISKDHMVLLLKHGQCRFVPASILKKGDALVTESREPVTIQSITTVVRRGVYAPFTASGNLVVNHVLASTYIAYQDSEYLTIGSMTTDSVHISVASSYFHFLQSSLRVA